MSIIAPIQPVQFAVNLQSNKLSEASEPESLSGKVLAEYVKMGHENTVEKSNIIDSIGNADMNNPLKLLQAQMALGDNLNKTNVIHGFVHKIIEGTESVIKSQ